MTGLALLICVPILLFGIACFIGERIVQRKLAGDMQRLRLWRRVRM